VHELPPLPISTVLCVRELESGRVLMEAVADPRRASYGDEATAQVSMELFLAELLRRSGADVRARYSLPDQDVSLTHVEVPQPNARELVGRALSFAMPCVVLPHRRARWVLVLPLGLTVYVGRGEDLDAIVASEASRHIAALQPSGFERLAYFCARDARLERVEVTVERRGAVEATKALRAKIDRAHRRKGALATLKAVGRQVHAKDVRGPEPVGLDAALGTLTALLGGDARRSVALTGPESVGKSALVEAWLRASPDRWLFTTSAAQLVAGMSFLGQWQERVRRVMESAETLDAVLWLDDLRDLLGHRRGAFDLAGAIRPWLDEGRVRLVGELTPESADLFATRQAGLFASMHPLRVEAQGPREGAEALRRHLAHAKKHERRRPSLRADAIETVVELTDRFLPYRPFPAKAVRLFEELRSAAERRHSGAAIELGAADVYAAFSRSTGVPEFLLRDDLAWRTERATELLGRRIVGQRDAVRAVVEALAVVKAGLAPGDKPLSSFLFVGPTGVGKTALARALAELLFGSPDRLLRFDMSELSDPGAAERLLRGVGGDEGRLTSAVRQQPFCVVLLDEIEKAHPSVFDLLLGVLGEGRLTDARGKTAYFHDAIVVMTSNLGTEHRARPVGIDPPPVDDAGRYAKAVEQHFRPELVNRIDRIVPFAPMSRVEIRRVADLAVQTLALRRGLGELGVRLSVTEAALDRLAEAGYDAAYGARALRRQLEDGLVAPVARLLGPLGREARGATVVCRAPDEPASPDRRTLGRLPRGPVVIEAVRGEVAVDAPQRDPLEAIASRRRWAKQKLELPTVEDQRERHDYLLAELSYGKPSAAHGAMQLELHALRARLDALDAAIGALESIEELVLSAALAGEPADAMADEAQLAELAFSEALLALLLGTDSRHRAIVLLQEHDAHRPLDRYLGQLLAVAPERGWRIRGHVWRAGPPRPPGWPTDRGWGPACDAEQLAAVLGREERKPLSVIVRASGEHVGTLLALEAGLHRHYEPAPTVEQATFVVRMLSSTRDDLEDVELDERCAQPHPVPAPAQRRLLPAVRDVHADAVDVDAVETTVDVLRDAYWERIDAIALHHLLVLEGKLEDRAIRLASPLDAARSEREAAEADR